MAKDDAEGKTNPLPWGGARIDSVPDEFATLVSAKPLAIGQVIGERYKLVEHLGNGGMGQVFVAENLSIRRRVAVKVLRANLLADASFRKRFQIEAEAIAAIEHRNVARFYDLVVGDPTFLVMEFIPGPTLSAVLKAEGKLEIARAIHLARRLAWGLHAAHRAGVIHRDLKPSNVILFADPELGEEPKLIDFGVAKLAGSTAKAEDAVTRSGQVVGTPHYMSPEQVGSDAIDARSDIYSLGCVLHHLVAGAPPFSAVDEVKLMYHHVHTPAPSIATLRPDAPPALDAVLQRALAKDPNARFVSMQHFAEALGDVEKQLATATTGTTTTIGRRPPALPAKSGALVPVALAVAVLAFAAGFAVRGRNHTTTPPPTTTATAAPGFVVVTSRPSDAAVELDGKPLPQHTPALVHGLAAGTHRLRLSAAGHAPVEQQLSLAAGERAVVDVALPPESRDVEIATVPTGAFVYVDGRMLIGRTPLHTQLANDDFHEVRVELPGYEVATRSVKPEFHDPTLTFQLVQETQPRGTLWIDANSSAEVVLDGVDTGFATPTPAMRVAVGEHAVELRADDGRAAHGKVHVTKGATVHLTLELVARGHK